MSDQQYLFQQSTIYPFNHVHRTESGHFTEFDDNKGSERISINHRSGSYMEFHPNADFSSTINGNYYSTVYANSHIHVCGFSMITVDKNLKLLVNSTKNQTTNEKSYDLDIEVEEGANVNISIKKGNCNICIDEGDVNLKLEKGDMNIVQNDGDYKHKVNGNYILDVSGEMNIHVGGNEIKTIKGGRATFIEGKLDYLEMNNLDAHLEVKGARQSTIMSNTIYEKAFRNISRAEREIILETTDPIYGDFTITSSANLTLASGWNPITKSKSSSKNPKMYFYANKTSQGGDFWFYADNNLNIFTKNNTYFQITGGELHVDVETLKTNWNPSISPNPNKIDKLNPTYIIDYEDIINNGFPQIVLNRTIKQ